VSHFKPRLAATSGASRLPDSSSRRPLVELNQLIRENRVSEYSSPNLALGMSPVEFSVGTSRWVWSHQPPAALNPFGTVQGGYLAVFIDELFSTAIASVLEVGELAMTAEFKVTFLSALSPGRLLGSAKVIRRSRSLAFLEAQIAAENGPAAVTASSTWAVMRRPVKTEVS
jgi:uncharacterized protein (TIGR00369 family)